MRFKKNTRKLIGGLLLMFAFTLPLSVTFQSVHTGHSAVLELPSLSLNFVHADEAPAAPAAEAPDEDEVKEPTWADSVLNALAGSGALVTGIIMLAEILMRAFPSKKPKSLLVPIRYACVSLATFFTFFANLTGQLIDVAQRAEQSTPAKTVKTV